MFYNLKLPLSNKKLPILHLFNLIILFKGPDEVMKFFTDLFPEVSESNSVGQLSRDSFKNWREGQNEVVVELDPAPPRSLEGAKDVYVGGPAALFSAAIQVLEDPS